MMHLSPDTTNHDFTDDHCSARSDNTGGAQLRLGGAELGIGGAQAPTKRYKVTLMPAAFIRIDM